MYSTDGTHFHEIGPGIRAAEGRFPASESRLNANPSPVRMRDHPDPNLLERFMRGELSGATGRPECRMIVRHLLADCPTCARITRRFWALGELPVGTDRTDPSDLLPLTDLAPLVD